MRCRGKNGILVFKKNFIYVHLGTFRLGCKNYILLKKLHFIKNKITSTYM